MGVTGDCTRLAKFGEFSSSCVGSTQDLLSPRLYGVALVTVLKVVSIRCRYLIGTKCTITTSRQGFGFSILNLFKVSKMDKHGGCRLFHNFLSPKLSLKHFSLYFSLSPTLSQILFTGIH